MRFRRALDRENVTEAFSAGSELPHVGLAEALELCLSSGTRLPSAAHVPPYAGTAVSAGRLT